MINWLLLLTLNSWGLAPSGEVYTLCFNSGRKCHSVFTDRTEGRLNGYILGTAPLTPSKSTEFKKTLVKILGQEKVAPSCSDPVEFLKMIGNKETSHQTYCYDELKPSTKNALAKWIKSLPKLTANLKK